MGEITVFGIAALGVANLVAASAPARSAPGGAHARSPGSAPQSMIFEQVTRMIFHLTLLVSLYVMLARPQRAGRRVRRRADRRRGVRVPHPGRRHRRAARRRPPVAGRADRDRHAAGGRDRRSCPLIAGNEFLESSVVHVTLPVIGDVKLVSAAVFDLGVYLLVIGVVIIVLEPPRLAHPRRRRGARGGVDA